MDAVPTHAQLGAALRAAAASSRRLGDENKWRAAPGSETAGIWTAAAKTQDPLQLTLTEADVEAVLLLRSALAHADEVGRAISTQRPFLPQSIGRIAVEHALRALHLAVGSATPTERAERRLDNMFYALTESEWQREGYAKKANLSREAVPDLTHVRTKAEARAAALGLTVTTTRNGGRRVSKRGRPSTMALAETYSRITLGMACSRQAMADLEPRPRTSSQQLEQRRQCRALTRRRADSLLRSQYRHGRAPHLSGAAGSRYPAQLPRLARRGSGRSWGVPSRSDHC